MTRQPTYKFLPFGDGLNPIGLVNALRDRWWLIHPEKGFAFFQGRSPQCNSHEVIVRSLVSDFPNEWAEIRFYPLVCVPIYADDFDYKLPAQPLFLAPSSAVEEAKGMKSIGRCVRCKKTHGRRRYTTKVLTVYMCDPC